MGKIQGVLRWHPKASTAKVGRLRALAFVAVVACLGVFASGAAAQNGATAKPTLRVAATYSYDQFWSHFGLYSASGREGSMLTGINFAALVHETPGGKLAPALATSWQILKSKAGPNKLFELTLRKDARFADGAQVDAAAVVNYFNWFAKANQPYGTLVGPKPVFTAVGKWKVRAQLTIPTPHFFQLLADTGPLWGFVASPRCVADPVNTWTKGDCGAGPFMLDAGNSVKGSVYKHVPNPYYYDKANLKWGGVEQRVIATTSSLLQALQAGQIDVAAVGNDASAIPAAVAAGQKVYWATTGQFVLLPKQYWGNTSLPGNKLVRQAINYAIDRKAIADATGAGYSKPIHQYQTLDGINPKYNNAYPYNPTKAKALLTQAGYPNGFSYKAYTFNATQTQYTTLIAKYLGDVGIKVEVIPTPAANSRAVFELTPFGNAQLNAELTATIYRVFNRAVNASATVSDQTSSRIFYKGLKSANPIPAYQQLWARATEEAFFVPICTLPLVYFASPKIAGINVSRARVGAIFVTELSPK
jgi:peptide/nickel transport system substrate-binding protein